MPVRSGSAALSPRLAGEGADGASRLDGLGDGAQWRSHLGTLGIPLLIVIYINRNNDSDRANDFTDHHRWQLDGWMCCTSVMVLVARALRTGMRRGSNLSADMCGAPRLLLCWGDCVLNDLAYLHTKFSKIIIDTRTYRY